MKYTEVQNKTSRSPHTLLDQYGASKQNRPPIFCASSLHAIYKNSYFGKRTVCWRSKPQDRGRSYFVSMFCDHVYFFCMYTFLSLILKSFPHRYSLLQVVRHKSQLTMTPQIIRLNCSPLQSADICPAQRVVSGDV